MKTINTESSRDDFLPTRCAARMLRQQQTSICGPAHKKAALALGAFLTILCLGSFLYLSLPRDEDAEYTADIFQNGTLLFSIPLNETPENRIFTIESENGGYNEIEIGAEGIRILSASCPDRLCVRQGFLQSPGIPIVCLPNRLVIRLRPSSETGEPDDIPDAVTY